MTKGRKCNILGLAFLVCFGLIFNYSSAQKNITYDKLLKCDEIVDKDTIAYYYEDNNGKPYYIMFPINSNISFKTDLNDLFLHTASAEISNDTLIIYLTKQTFGLIIDVKMHIIGSKQITKINYWTVFPNEIRTLKADKMALILDHKEFKKGDKVIGKVNMKISGKLFNEMTMRDQEITGEIDGCFNIEISKLLKSRLN